MKEILINNVIDDLDGDYSTNINSCFTYDSSMKNLSIENNSIFILHLNISSLQKHFDELHELLRCLPTVPSHPDIFCTTEARLTDTPPCDIELPKCIFLHRNSPNVVGEVGVYIKHGTQFKFIQNFNLGLAGVEKLWLEFSGSGCFTESKRVLGCIYGHPTQKNKDCFLEQFNNCLVNLNQACKNFHILGDMNINLFSNNYPQNIAKHISRS